MPWAICICQMCVLIHAVDMVSTSAGPSFSIVSHLSNMHPPIMCVLQVYVAEQAQPDDQSRCQLGSASQAVTVHT